MDQQNPLSVHAILRGLPRLFDDRPLWAQLNVTSRCNLECRYCTEYDNARSHVPTEDLLARIEKCAELGTLHVDFIGGEPLLHPDIEDLVLLVRRFGMTAGMTTNGFLLTAERMERLIEAGLGRLQISVDSVAPRRGVPKSLKTLLPKIKLAAGRPELWFRVNVVLCPETLDEVPHVAEACLALGVGLNIALAHQRGRLVQGPLDDRYRTVLDGLRRRKREGATVDTPYILMSYYDEILNGAPPEWTCAGGTKCFYVMPDGEFRFCSQVGTGLHLSHVTAEHLTRFRGPKGCEHSCGVDCVVHTSLPFSRPLACAAVEAGGWLNSLLARLGRPVSG